MSAASERRPVARILLTVLVVVGAIVFLVFWLAFLRPLPQTTGTIRVAGLKAQVEVVRDSLGIPHLRAGSIEDLYLAQGFATAQQRFWQMELLRRVGRGEIAEIGGPAALQLDIDTRTLGLRAIAERSVSTLPDDQKRHLAAYAAGVNEYLRAHSSRLPVEFRLLGLTPRPWTEADSLVIGLHMFRTLSTTWKDEVMKAMILRKAGRERSADLLPTSTNRDHPVGEAIALAAFSIPRSLFDDEPFEASTPGSNNWVVSGAHTASGRPMLANDPHLEFSVPGIWFTVQLEAPGMNVAGVSLPGLPAVIVGHNENIAWGVTNLGADVQDLYFETFSPGDPNSYAVDGEWRQAEIRQEVIHVKGQEDHILNVKLTRHGPIILDQPNGQFALRWTAAEPGVWRFPFPQLNAARNWQDFTSALRGYPGPAQNFVYADAAGNIGYYGAGLIPVRRAGDGSLPVIGSQSANDWSGWIPFEQLPHAYNPPSGIIATANGRVTPDGYPYPVATNWEAPDRTERIYQLLDPARKFTAEDFRRIQVDIYAGHHLKIARAVAAAVKKAGGSAAVQKAARALDSWDGVATKDSYAPTLAQLTRLRIIENLVGPVLGEDAVLYRWHMIPVFLERVLRDRPAAWLPQKFADYDRLWTACLDEALAAGEKRFGTPDMEQWHWGRMMQTTFTHPIGGRITGLRRLFNLGPFEQPGTGYTIKQTTLTLGPSMRLVVDFADLNAATLTLTTGESGHPLDPHYRDQFPAWQTGEGKPLVFKGASGDRLTLIP